MKFQRKLDDSKLRDFLVAEAQKSHPQIFDREFIALQVGYAESISPDAIDGDKWLESRTSYIWKVGVLSVVDGNKSDWAHLFIGHWRSPEHDCELIGHLFWFDGENDDIARSLARYLKCAEYANTLLSLDDYDEPGLNELTIQTDTDPLAPFRNAIAVGALPAGKEGKPKRRKKEVKNE